MISKGCLVELINHRYTIDSSLTIYSRVTFIEKQLINCGTTNDILKIIYQKHYSSSKIKKS